MLHNANDLYNIYTCTYDMYRNYTNHWHQLSCLRHGVRPIKSPNGYIPLIKNYDIEIYSKNQK